MKKSFIKLLIVFVVTMVSCAKEDVIAVESEESQKQEQEAPAKQDENVDDVLSAIPDRHFRAWAEKQMGVWDKDADGVLSREEAAAVTLVSLPVAGEIETLEGIQYFTGITYLSCVQNRLHSLDLSYNTNLTGVAVDGNELTSLTLPYSSRLSLVTCELNQLSSLNVSHLTGLSDLYCGGNQLTKLDVSGCKRLGNLQCWGNLIEKLDVSGLEYLAILNCQVNEMTSLNLDGCTNLQQLSAICCLLEGVDISDCTKLWLCSVEDNPGKGGAFSILSSFDEAARPKGKIPGRDYNYWFPTEWIYGGQSVTAIYTHAGSALS